MEEQADSYNNIPSSPSDSTPRSPTSVDELEEEATPMVAAMPGTDPNIAFRHVFESYVESNFGRGTRSQTITRETYENYKSILIGDSDSSRRRMRLHDQGYRLGTFTVPEQMSDQHDELVLWRYKSEGRGNNYMSTKTRPRIVAPVEDFYSIITSMHFASPSASGQKKAFKMISKRYVGIPREVVIFYMRNCPHCASVTRRRSGAPVGAVEAKRSRPSDEEKEKEKEGEREEKATDEKEKEKEKEEEEEEPEPRSEGYDCFKLYARLLIDKNLNRILPVTEQPPEKVDAIVAVLSRHFPEYAPRAELQVTRYLYQCRRQRRKPVPAAGPVSLSPPTARRLVEACRSERASQIRATADNSASCPIKALTEAEVVGAIRTPESPETDLSSFSSFLPAIANMDLSGAAANNLLMASGYGGLSADVDPSVVLASLSSLPVQPNYLAGALRIVGVLLLMVANQMEATGNSSSSGSATTNSGTNS